MTDNKNYDALLNEVLNRVIENNLQAKPGTPMADLKSAIETAIKSLPELEFEEFSKAINDTDAERELIDRAPEIIGWDADHIVNWIETISNKTSEKGS
ncbi:MAG: hypothetical protein PVH61_21375 [Candidatus Aminicenantes bacterium]|jgi:hypothetical protein